MSKVMTLPSRQRIFRMSLRHTLISLFALLGLALLAAVSAQLVTTIRDYHDASNAARFSTARELLARLSVVISNERSESYLALLNLAPKDAPAASGFDRGLIADAEKAVVDLYVPGGRGAVRAIDVQLSTLDDEVSQALAKSSPQFQAELAGRTFQAYSEIIRQLNSLRGTLLAREQPVDRNTSQAFQMRRYVSVLMESLSRNLPLVQQIAAAPPGSIPPALLKQAQENATRATMAFELLASQPHALTGGLPEGMAELTEAFTRRYRPSEARILTLAVQGLPMGGLAQTWKGNADEVAAKSRALQETLFAYSRDNLGYLETRAMGRLVLWVAFLLGGIVTAVFGARTVLIRLVRPLRAVRSSMLRLADGDLKTPLPEVRHMDEVGVMADSLRVFKSNAERRARLHSERLALHDRLKEAYRQLKLDLEAAAAVQTALLPVASRLGGVRFTGLLRPSHFISGDTYDVLRQPNSAVHFFHIDVAGHGAAAALVSVASHSTLTQAVLKRGTNETLADTVARINADWPEHLPFFTMVLGELNPESGQGVIIQAGHPPPILLRSTGEVEQLGQGGLPVGVLAGATYDEVRFAYGKGDRLIVYSDGVTETENPAGEPFSEGRLLDCVRELGQMSTDNLLNGLLEVLRGWRTLESFEDDVTVLVLEATEDADN